jgi:hypothetical protein
MSLAGLEPAITASEQPQTHALDRAATGIGGYLYAPLVFVSVSQLRQQHENVNKDARLCSTIHIVYASCFDTRVSLYCSHRVHLCIPKESDISQSSINLSGFVMKT